MDVEKLYATPLFFMSFGVFFFFFFFKFFKIRCIFFLVVSDRVLILVRFLGIFFEWSSFVGSCDLLKALVVFLFFCCCLGDFGTFSIL